MLRAQKGAADQGPEQEALGRSPGGFSTKIHLSVSALGLPVKIRLTPGQEADVKQAEPLLEGYLPEAVIADKAYDSDSLVDLSTRPTITLRSGVSLPQSRPRIWPQQHVPKRHKNSATRNESGTKRRDSSASSSGVAAHMKSAVTTPVGDCPASLARFAGKTGILGSIPRLSRRSH